MKVEVNNYIQDRWSLRVNGYVIGNYIYGAKKKYLDPDAWAREMIPKRLNVLKRNLRRVLDEADKFQAEINALEGK